MVVTSCSNFWNDRIETGLFVPEISYKIVIILIMRLRLNVHKKMYLRHIMFTVQQLRMVILNWLKTSHLINP